MRRFCSAGATAGQRKNKRKPTMEPFCLIIDGGRVPTEEHFEVLNPAKEEVKRSGVGVEFGEEGLLEYTDIQVVFS